MSDPPEEHGTPQEVEEVEVEAAEVGAAELPGHGTPQAEAGESR